MTVRECYDQLGADYEGVVSRLMTEERVKKFVVRLPQDPSFSHLRKAMEQQDAKGAFMGVHTIKGLAMNLGLTELARVAEAMTEELRDSSITPKADELYTELEQSYKETIRLIGMLSETGGTVGE